MELPDAILQAAERRRLPYADFGLLLAIVAHQDDGKVSGSITELAHMLGVSKDTLHTSMKRLHAAGFVNWVPTDSRYRQTYCEIIVPEFRMMNHPADNQDDEAVTSVESFDEGLESTVSTGESKGSTDKGLRSTQVGGEGLRERGKDSRFAHDSPPRLISEKLLTRIRSTFDPNRRADLNTWAIHVDRLIRLDGRTPDEIEHVIDWLYECDGRDSTFWRTNVLSTKTLRDKFPQLVAKMNGWKGHKRKPKIPTIKCPKCEGSGFLHGEDDTATRCPICGGAGELAEVGAKVK